MTEHHGSTAPATIPSRRRVSLHGFPDREREVGVSRPLTAARVLDELQIRREMVLVFADGEPVPEDVDLADAREIRIVRIVTGGAGREPTNQPLYLQVPVRATPLP
ncbi:MAG: MoaD/ThiS family protein [Thermoplasmatota archaeon]